MIKAYIKWLLPTVVIFLSNCGFSHANTWNMRTFRVDWTMSADECNNLITDLAAEINDGMVAQGYSAGILKGGNKSVVLDQIGGRDISYYLYCTDFNLLVFTGHAARDGDPVFAAAYQEELNDFFKLREAYRSKH